MYEKCLALPCCFVEQGDGVGVYLGIVYWGDFLSKSSKSTFPVMRIAKAVRKRIQANENRPAFEPLKDIFMSRITIKLTKDSYTSFTEALSYHRINFSKVIQLSEVPVNAGSIIAVFSAIKDATPWGALALALVAWLRTKSSREVTITLEDNKVLNLKGYSAKEIEKILDQTRAMAVMETPQEDKDSE